MLSGGGQQKTCSEGGGFQPSLESSPTSRGSGSPRSAASTKEDVGQRVMEVAELSGRD
jgi:hypothetical protein